MNFKRQKKPQNTLGGQLGGQLGGHRVVKNDV
jgi:hypothetical protein